MPQPPAPGPTLAGCSCAPDSLETVTAAARPPSRRVTCRSGEIERFRALAVARTQRSPGLRDVVMRLYDVMRFLAGFQACSWCETTKSGRLLGCQHTYHAYDDIIGGTSLGDDSYGGRTLEPMKNDMLACQARCSEDPECVAFEFDTSPQRDAGNFEYKD